MVSIRWNNRADNEIEVSCIFRGVRCRESKLPAIAMDIGGWYNVNNVVNDYGGYILMETQILEILEMTAITVGGFLIKKYVFLEQDLETKKQRNFYMVSFLLISIPKVV